MRQVVLQQTQRIASRFWSDLVCPEDYFAPQGGWMYTQRCPSQPGEFIVAMNPNLHPGGDFVSRCLWVRVDGLHDTLGRLRAACAPALDPPGRTLAGPWAEVERSWQVLADSVAQLRQACLQGPEQPLRDACILLTQVYAAFQPRPDVAWLGLPEPVVRRGALLMRHRWTHTRNVELAERTAAALHELPRLYADAAPGQSALEEAVAAGGLVVVRQPPAVYWQGELVAVEWGRYRRGWQFFRRLAEKARHGAVLEEKDVYADEPVSESALGTVFHRLKALLPASLWRHVHPSSDPRGYRLELARDRLHVFPQPATSLPVAARE
jgi:hypothetical protein